MKRGLIFCFLDAVGWLKVEGLRFRLRALEGAETVGLRAADVVMMGVEGVDPAGELKGVSEFSITGGRRERGGRQSLRGGGREGANEF